MNAVEKLLKEATLSTIYYPNKVHPERIVLDKELFNQALALSRAECMWKKDDDDFETDIWHSDCGVAWEFTEGGPKENHYIYCHGCGKRIKEVKE